MQKELELKKSKMEEKINELNKSESGIDLQIEYKKQIEKINQFLATLNKKIKKGNPEGYDMKNELDKYMSWEEAFKLTIEESGSFGK